MVQAARNDSAAASRHGHAAADSLVGGDGPDLLRGRAGADTLDGGGGPDTIAGRAGADSLLGGTGPDVVLGGSGGDALYGDTTIGPFPPLGPPGPLLGNDNTLRGGAGDDTIHAGAGADIVLGGAGNDLILGQGAGRVSPAGDDAFLRLDGADLLRGGAGDDSIDGGGSDDTIEGGSGGDELAGGYGADLLRGGTGADLFAFHRLDPFRSSFDTGVGEGARDVVADFHQGQDLLDLRGYTEPFGPGGPGTLEAVFLGDGGFTAAAGLQIRYDIIADGSTVVQFARGDGATAPDAPRGEIELRGAHTLTEADFLF